ncbi:MAG: hypothetical protein BXU00_02885 [Candidatus Nanoclepta minutus]|uniref:Archaeal flagellar protein F n=1 Tax=Candidatus Nanoclepta minutus TaxID=1940235 RepID=A0A397WRF7_9ARCH|nr:MAG: hypothetical protein BXU00_02885 [Candidatus Nanoclepta minutus]
MRGDLSQIFGAITGFILIIVVILIFSYITSYNVQNFDKILEKNYEFYEKRSLELVDFLNNSTNISNPLIIIKNIGKVSLDPSCFSLYIEGNKINFTYQINEVYHDNLLNPSENAALYFSYPNTGWKKVVLISCNGKRFETLIYFYS